MLNKLSAIIVVFGKRITILSFLIILLYGLTSDEENIKYPINLIIYTLAIISLILFPLSTVLEWKIKFPFTIYSKKDNEIIEHLNMTFKDFILYRFMNYGYSEEFDKDYYVRTFIEVNEELKNVKDMGNKID